MIAALYVMSNGPYFGLAEVDPWDEARDARKYSGPWPVVAHPPCSRWCQLAYVNQKRYGHKVGDDGGCFASALQAVKKFGGVLEHPAKTYAWAHFNLPLPRRGRWIKGAGGWVTQVSQGSYGHPAIKDTWLFYVGKTPPPLLDWKVPTPVAQISYLQNKGNSDLPRLSKKDASITPAAFQKVLIELARQSQGEKK